MLDACRELNVALVAYFPLASGRLTRAGRPGPEPKLAVLQRPWSEVGQAHQASAARRR